MKLGNFLSIRFSPSDLFGGLNNPVNLLIMAQAAFLAIGLRYLDFGVTALDIVLSVASAVCTEVILSNYAAHRDRKQRPKLFFPSSAVAAALGICIFFRATAPWYFAIAAIAAIASKYLILIRGKHVFNPSNFAIVVMVFLFASSTTIEFTQWGNDVRALLLIAAISLAIAWRSGVIVTTLSFFASYSILLLILMRYSPLVFAATHYGLLSPSLVLFASFMITDPRTSPTGFYPRLMHGFTVAGLYFFLDYLGIRYALFLATFLITIVNAIVRYAFPSGIRILPTGVMPNNMPAFAGALILVVFMAGTLARSTAAYAPPSLSFILLGVEGAELRQCDSDPLFKRKLNTGISTDPSLITFGAAWGDYDNDGWDDLFVSSINKQSALYHNDHGHFIDVTRSSGLPPLRSSSAFFADYDNDGRTDLFTIESTLSSGTLGVDMNSKTPNYKLAVYRNEGGGTFKDVTEAVGLAVPELGSVSFGTLSFADYNNDGYLDMAVAFLSAGTTAISKQNTAILKSIADARFPNKAATLACEKQAVSDIIQKIKDLPEIRALNMDWPDFLNKGGCLRIFNSIDPYNGNAEDGNVKAPAAMTLLYFPGKIMLFENHKGYFTKSATFEEARAHALKMPNNAPIYFNNPTNYISGIYWQPLSFDYDGDGRMDIFFAVDSGSNLLFHNDGDFKFHDVTKNTGLAIASSGMGVASADYQNNGRTGIFVTNTSNDFLFENKGTAFRNMTNTPETDLDIGNVGWGTAFVDYDLDGWQDLYVVNGDLSMNVGSGNEFAANLARPVFRIDALYHNVQGAFRPDTANLCPDTQSGRALAISDYDNNGTPDAFVGNLGSGTIGPITEAIPQGGNVLLADTITGKHYLKIRLHGTVSNSMGVGAVVRVIGNGIAQSQQLTLGGSFYSENSQALLFGLGTSTAPVEITVTWPSGQITSLKDIAIDRTMTITE